MDELAVKTLEYYLAAKIATIADPKPELALHDQTDGQGEEVELTEAFVVVTVPYQPSKPINNPIMDRPYEDKTKVALYVRTPAVIKNPGATGPDELDGELIHITYVNAIRNLWDENQGGFSVPAEVTSLGCQHEVYGFYVGTDTPTTVRREHLFIVTLETLEVT